MLNRKMSDYIFYGSLFLITLLIVLLRFTLIGAQDARIESINRDNISIQQQIDDLNEVVQENKEIQTSHLYELYDIIPNVYSSNSLIYKTVAILEGLGIDESDEFNRTVYVNDNFGIADNNELFEYSQEYLIVRVDVGFTTNNAQLVQDLVDEIYLDEQLFIINYVNYVDTEGSFSIEVQVSFLAIYDVEITEES